MNKKIIRAVGIVIYESKILLIQRRDNKKNFWVFPGGSVEKNESIEEAVIRELDEETSVRTKIIKLLYKHAYPDIGHEQYFFLCKFLSGEPKLGNYNEKETMKNSDQLYIPLWIEIDKINNLLLYPLEIRDWIIEDYKNKFSESLKTAVILTKDLRNEI